MSNEFSNLAWTKGDIPRDRPGSYIVWLDRPVLGNNISVVRASQGMNSLIVTIGGLFEFDCDNRRILAWVSTEGLEPIL